MEGLSTKIRRELLRAGVKPADGLVVAVSGGPDSMALLDLLRKLNRELVVVHVNHGIRKEAHLDEAVVRQYCLKHKLELVVCQLNLGKLKTGIEEKAREARYAALLQVAQAKAFSWVITAHTADDQVETIIANWLRGSLVRGLGGMRLATGKIVRPLLGTRKRELADYVRKHKIRYAVDKSNLDINFTRNQIRLQLLPSLRKFNARLDEQLLGNAELWQQVDLALTELAQQYLKRVGTIVGGKVVLSVSKLGELTPLMQGEVVKLAIVAAGGGLTGLTKTHFGEVLKILVSPRATVAKRRLGGELFCAKAYGKITISRS